jgi:isopenicillin N synthase-like dioxygenase
MLAVPGSDNIAAKRGSFHEVPVIDFKDAFSNDHDKRKRLAENIYDACVRVGFFYIRNHGVDESIMTAIFSAANDFFNLPLEDKMAIDLNRSPHFRGYTKLMVCAAFNKMPDPAGRECGSRIAGRRS